VEVRVLQRQGCLHRHHLRQTLVMRGKSAAAALVDQLQHTPEALGAANRYSQEVAGGQRRFFVDAAVETVVMLGVVDDKGLPVRTTSPQMPAPGGSGMLCRASAASPEAA